MQSRLTGMTEVVEMSVEVPGIVQREGDKGLEKV